MDTLFKLIGYGHAHFGVILLAGPFKDLSKAHKSFKSKYAVQLTAPNQLVISTNYDLYTYEMGYLRRGSYSKHVL